MSNSGDNKAHAVVFSIAIALILLSNFSQFEVGNDTSSSPDTCKIEQSQTNVESALSQAQSHDSFGSVYVVNLDSRSVSVIGLYNNCGWKSVDVGFMPRGVAVSTVNAYVVNSYNDTVSIIGTSNNTLWKVVSVGLSPYDIAISSSNAYVTNTNSGTYSRGNVSVIGLLNNTVWKTIGVGTMPHGIAVSSSNAYVANNADDTVSIIGLSNSTEWKTVSVGTWPYEVAVSSSNAYVTNSYSGTVSVIGLNNNTVWRNVTVGSQPEGIGISNSNAYVVNTNSGTVSVFGLSNNTPWKAVGVGGMPEGVAVSNSNAYVSNYNSGTVSIIGLYNNTNWKSVRVGFGPESVAVYQPFTLNFIETGLPVSSAWNVTLNSIEKSTNASKISFTEPNGVYSFHVGNYQSYHATPSSGSVIVNGSDQNISISFNRLQAQSPPVTYSVTFTETGIPTGTSWWVSITDGNSISVNKSATGSVISVDLPNGTYNYAVHFSSGYSGSNIKGSFSVAGQPVTVRAMAESWYFWTIAGVLMGVSVVTASALLVRRRKRKS